MKDKALKQALNALETKGEHHPRVYQAITVIKAALSKPAQEPVAWTTMPEAEDWCFVSGNKDPNGKLDGKWFPLYTAPPQRKPLTDEAVLDIADYYLYNGGKTYGVLDFARAIEAAQGIKENT